MEILAVARVLDEHGLAFAAEGAGGAGLTINLFWIIVAGLNFIIFALVAYRVVLMPVGKRLEERRDRIEQGLKDADAARRDREAAADQRQGILNEARREASEIVQRAQKVADDERAKGVAQTQTEIDRMRERAVADIDAERKRALADVRSQVADLALLAAGKVVGETISDAREKRLVNEFLAQVSAQVPAGNERN
ncbi:MAG: F0F1 ATP synthase subunit B [Candidatus Limnocylindrales bacterium]